MKFKLDATKLWDYFRAGKDNNLVKTDNVVKCPYCKEVLNLQLPTVHYRLRDDLSRCYKCYEQFVVTAKVENVTIKYDIKLRKISK